MNNMTAVGSTSLSDPTPISGLDSLRKISNTLPPEYATVLEMDKYNNGKPCNGTEPVLRYFTRLPEDPEPPPTPPAAATMEPDYANLPPVTRGQGSQQSFKEPMPLPPLSESSLPRKPEKIRRSSLGVPGGRRPSLGLPSQNGLVDMYPGRLSPSERARSHNVISVSEESGSPKDIDQSEKRYSNGGRVSSPQRQQQQHGLQIRDDWYRASTPSMLSHGDDVAPPLSPTSHTSGGSAMGGGFPIQNRALSATTSHKSLQLSFSNPASFAKNARSQSSMGQSTAVANGSSQARMTNGTAAKSAQNVGGKYATRSSASMGRNCSVPAAMDQYVDKITDV